MNSSTGDAGAKPTVAVVDTTIPIDYFKAPMRKERIDSLLRTFNFVVTTSIAVLEFKATLLQQMMTIHDRLSKDRRFTWVRDALLESQHSQAKLRAHIFNNILEVFPTGPMAELTAEQDRRLAEQAKLKLRIDINRVLTSFRQDLVGGTIDSIVRCDRSREKPTLRKGRASFESNIPVCRRGTNKTCDVETVILDRVGPLLEKIIPPEIRSKVAGGVDLGELPREYQQLARSWLLVEQVRQDPDADLNANQCRNCGDALIVAEATGSVTDAVSHNSREWVPLCREAGIRHQTIDYSGDED